MEFHIGERGLNSRRNRFKFSGDYALSSVENVF
jgi:hypothetical protein